MRSIIFSILILVMIAGCAIPPREVHSAVGISRDTVIDPNPQGEAPKFFAGGVSFSRGAGNQDIGKQNDSTNIDVNGELRIADSLAIGLQPSISSPDGSFDSGSNFDITLYGRWRFFSSARWTMSLYPGIGYAKNSAESDGQTCGFLVCTGSGINSNSKVEVIDPRLGWITSYYFNERCLLSVIPTLYWSHESGSFSDAGVQQFAGSETGLEYSAMLAYGYIFDLKDGHAMVQVSAGASTHRGFGTFTNQHIVPLVQLGVQFALGKDVK
jgi:hypothetical protein